MCKLKQKMQNLKTDLKILLARYIHGDTKKVQIQIDIDRQVLYIDRDRQIKLENRITKYRQ